MHHSHPLAATAARGLDQHRITNRRRQAQILFGVVAQGAVRSWYTWHTRFLHSLDRGDLVPHETQRFRPWSNENEAATLNAFGKVGVFS